MTGVLGSEKKKEKLCELWFVYSNGGGRGGSVGSLFSCSVLHCIEMYLFFLVDEFNYILHTKIFYTTLLRL